MVVFVRSAKIIAIKIKNNHRKHMVKNGVPEKLAFWGKGGATV